MNVKNLGLLNVLASILNGDESTSEYAITEYLVSRIDDIMRVTVNDIIDHAHVSRSSVRRYCNLLGYDNFSDFKENFSIISFPSNIHLRNFSGVSNYQYNLNAGLQQMFREMNEVVNKEVINNLTKKMESYDEILVFSANNTSSNLLKFQQELLYTKKIVKLVDLNLHYDNLRCLNTQDTLILVVSVSGLYAKAILKEIESLHGYKILVTANRSEKISCSFDEVIYLSERDVRNDRFGLLGKYGVTYFFDLLSENYIFRNK